MPVKSSQPAATSAASFAEHIKRSSAELTPADRRIAQVILSTNLLAGLETISRLAERAKVSGPTILRFAAKIGFENYSDFQQLLRSEIENRLASPADLYSQQAASSSAAKLASNAAEIFVDAIQRTLSRIDEAALDRISRLLADESRGIHLIGGRFTQHLAEVLWGHLHQLRPRTYMLRDSVVTARDHLVDLGRRDVLVIFDIRRYQDDLLSLAELAKGRRATIILVTDPLLSPVSRFANHVLTCDLDAPSPYVSLVPCMAVVELLVARLTRLLGDRGRQRIIDIEQLRSSE